MDDIAGKREVQASSLSDMNIYRSVVENIVKMNAELTDKIDLLYQAIPDLAIVMAHLSLCRSRNLLSLNEYNKLAELCLLRLNKIKREVNYTPHYFNNETDGA